MPKIEGLDKLVTALKDRAKRFQKTPEVHVVVEAPYALAVHEDMEAAHGEVYNQKHAADIAAGRDHARRPQEQAKFIETPLRQYPTEMRQAVHSALGDGLDLTEGLLSAGWFLVDKIQEIIPIDTGAMEASVYVKVE